MMKVFMIYGELDVGTALYEKNFMIFQKSVADVEGSS